MDAGLIGSLVLLALIDSTSFGTLLIPIWMMLAPGRLHPGRLLTFLATVAIFYLVLGVALTFGALALLDDLRPVAASGPFQVAQLVVGVALFAYSFRFGKKRKGSEPGRLLRWREQAMSGEGSPKALVVLALTAVTLEVATMLPYLAAIGLISAAELALPTTVAVLAGYCLVMVLPALVLLGARVVGADRVQPVLVWVNGWMTRSAAETTGWVLGIAGFLLAANAAQELGILEAIDSLSGAK
ncbi:Sap-like sulfolipid-1-addressing protein [Micromonospora pisi]|uniref:Sap-like sulfolipid-1-addressing protein n=1 Tax=Micromonospora pisi TaxID=589240 RepID=A0A495JGU4_9ACTN|nr:GAP family protein [Micromonospora pisi]RKR88127.1 Sap-like sulfolipid-1-addressing protein [Micromonospora pisi]